MLERDGEEIARATTIVKFDAGCEFPEHVHGGGEEFYMLQGIFSDANGDYPEGTYVRHPINSSHAPWSKDGCIFIVKLRQMLPNVGEDHSVIVHKTSNLWKIIDGIHILELFSNSKTGEHVVLQKWQPNSHVTSQYPVGGEEILVVEGDFQDEEGKYKKGTWIRNPAHFAGKPWTRKSFHGCTLWIKTGHLLMNP